MKILAVDDENTILFIVCEYLRWQGHALVTARNGQEGLARFMESPHSFDAVLTDINMPLLDGMAMVESIRRRAFTTPVLFMTATQDPHLFANRHALEPFDCLLKPFKLENMELQLQSMMERHPAGVQHRTPAHPHIAGAAPRGEAAVRALPVSM